MLLDLEFDVSTRDLSPVAADEALSRRVERFLYREARLLDESRHEEWQALWCEDGMYWIPREAGQESPYDHISIIWDDAMLRRVRARRLAHPRNWSQQPPARSVRSVTNIEIDGRDKAGDLVVSSVLQLAEWHREPRRYAARVCHKLSEIEGGTFRLRLKRVDLLECDAILDNLEIYL